MANGFKNLQNNYTPGDLIKLICIRINSCDISLFEFLLVLHLLFELRAVCFNDTVKTRKHECTRVLEKRHECDMSAARATPFQYFPCVVFCIIFKNKNFSVYIIQTAQMSLSNMCIALFVYQFVALRSLKLTVSF